LGIRPLKKFLVPALSSILIIASIIAGAQEASAGNGEKEEYKCYAVIVGEGDPGEAPTFPISLRDQFGDMENVLLDGLVEFCASADKEYDNNLFESPHAFFNHYNCYSFPIPDEAPFPMPPINPSTGEPFVVDLLGLGQFPDEFGVEVGIPIGICVPTTKIIPPINGGDPQVFPPVDTTHYKCYSITGDAPVPNDITLTDQFVQDDFQVGAPGILCTPALKVEAPTLSPDPGIPPPGPHIKCYDIFGGQADTSAINIMSNDQFQLNQQINLGIPDLVCTEVLKIVHGQRLVGGEFIPLDSTSLLVAGAQMNAAWMIPVIVAGIGFAIVIARKF